MIECQIPRGMKGMNAVQAITPNPHFSHLDTWWEVEGKPLEAILSDADQEARIV